MKLLMQAGILARGLVRRILARWQRPEDTIAYVLEQLQQALNRHKLHLAELIVEHQQGERQLAAVRLRPAADQRLLGRLSEQVAEQWRRIEQGRLTLVALASQIDQLKARQGEVRLRAELLEAQGTLRRLMSDLGATSVPGLLAQIDEDLGRREQVQRVLDQLDALSLSPRPSQETGLEPHG